MDGQAETPGLPPGYHWEGMNPNVIYHDGKIVKHSKCVINCKGLTWFHSHHVMDKEEGKALCRNCPNITPVSAPGGRNSNVIMHLSSLFSFIQSMAQEFPIFERLACTVLAISPCSADVERLFSKSGLIVGTKRTNMAPESVNMTTTLKCWLDGIGESLEEFTSANPATASAQASNSRFVRINVRLEFDEPTIFSEDCDEFDSDYETEDED